MNDLAKRWQTAAAQDQREWAQEGLILEVSERIHELLEREGISKAELAERLGISKARISQLFDGSRNLTLRSLADIGWALGIEFKLEIGKRVGKAMPAQRATRPRRKAAPVAKAARR